jgi:hypothetical protein
MIDRLLYVCGMLIPFTYLTLYLVGGALRPGYNHISDSVSELLSPGAPNKPLLTAIQMIYALLHVLSGIGVLRFVSASERGTSMAYIGAWMIIGVGVATIGTAVFPQDAAGTPATTPGQIHKILVFAALLPFSFLSTLLIGIWFRQVGISQGFATYSLISVGAIVLVGGAGAAMVETPYAGLGERISALVIHQWLFFLALKLFLQ